MSLVYDDRGHLIFAQVYRYKYYIATDQCGTPVMIFNQYGEWIREIMRSPYGHIVYDSNPYLYLPIDFCGGLLDQVTIDFPSIKCSLHSSSVDSYFRACEIGDIVGSHAER